MVTGSKYRSSKSAGIGFAGEFLNASSVVIGQSQSQQLTRRRWRKVADLRADGAVPVEKAAPIAESAGRENTYLDL